MRIKPLLCLLSSCTLAACAIPYQTPEARHQIERELGVDANDIVSISETNFCALRYGDEAVCHAKIGLGVLTRKGLVLTLYSGGHYRADLTLRSEDVLCGSTATSRETPEPVNMYTREYAVVLLPLNEQGKWNGSMHAQIIDYMLPNGQPLLIGADGKSSRPSDKSKVVAGMVPGTKIPYATTLGYMEQFNPCPTTTGEGH
ncbi:hypothetical protein [Pseudomonas vanderleydeniana]|uniref:Lipoprotein n=1 Tax=Pseudomonas vanderleydeniana TaxID=2745495 RepID=A0A9E6PQQ4_9PSED|nr:hypothetical protein [Pseudomonas vanderleydeniana]QXI30722.1 hypothetical protein HU752_012585 [Pseudomonas vanderleydeniana]